MSGMIRQTGGKRMEQAGSYAPKLLDQMRDCIRLRHCSLRTEDAYVDWARRFILFHGKRHPREMGAEEVQAFLTHLAVERGVSAATQNQAKAALIFLYQQFLGADLSWLSEVVAAKASRRLPVVLAPGEVKVKELHERDLREGFGEVMMSDALAVKSPRCAPRLGMAVGLPVRGAVRGPPHGGGPPPSPAPREHPEGGPSGRQGRRDRQAGVAPRPPAQLCHAPARGRARHQDHPGTAGPSVGRDDHDLHARAEPGRPGGRKPPGPDRALEAVRSQPREGREQPGLLCRIS